MPKKRVRTSVPTKSNESIAAVVLALVTICTLAGSDRFLTAPDSPHVAHANTSANPYRPVNGSYVPPIFGLPPADRSGQSPYTASSVSPARRTALERRLKALRRSADAVEKQIVRAEDTIDALQKKIDASPGRRNDALEDLVLTLTDNLARLEKRLAAVNTQIAAYEIMIDPSKDMSR